MFKRFYQEYGAINTGLAITTLLSVVGVLVMAVYTNLTSRTTVLEAKADVFTASISTLQSDVSWIKGSLEAKGFKPNK